MAFSLSSMFNDAQLNTAGEPASGYKVYWYAAGTTTPQSTYTDDTGGTAQANPVVLNSRGEPDSPIWLTAGTGYKAVLKTDADVTIRTVDDIYGVPSDFISGVYTPTLSNTTNVAASTAYQCQYSRNGTVVTVSGKVDIDPTAAAPTATVLGMSLPIASNIGAAEDLGGAANCPAVLQQAGISGDAANNRASFSYLAASTANASFYFVFQYRII